MAVALALQGHKVGLLDADIFGPSQPKMFNVEEARPYMVEVGGRELIEPAANYGVKLLSIGFLSIRKTPSFGAAQWQAMP